MPVKINAEGNLKITPLAPVHNTFLIERLLFTPKCEEFTFKLAEFEF